ncbi:MAG: YcaO-like family protein [Desulfobacterales bacterium]
MKPDNVMLHYVLKLVKTDSGTGYFACFPRPEPDFETGLRYARAHPNDEFIRRHLLRLINAWDRHTLARAISACAAADLFLLALFYEACLLNPAFDSLRRHFAADVVQRLADFTPLVFIGATLLADRTCHEQWIRLFGLNITGHKELPKPAEGTPGPPLPDRLVSEAGKVAQTLREVAGRRPAGARRQNAAALEAAGEAAGTAALALARLAKAGIVPDPEMRHESSLSPIALLRGWEMKTSVHNGRHRFALEGPQTAYGRGLDLESARAACVMEIVERCSAYATVVPGEIRGYQKPYRLLHGRASDLRRQHINHLDPNRLTLEVPYADDPFYWLEGQEAAGTGSRPIFVPAQCVFLFCNLDERKLFSALGSTGLASGSTMAAAKVSALLEVIERDSESVMPFSQQQCFEAETEDPMVGALLESYDRLGIRVQFQDITTPLGVPCCKCFVISGDGRIVKGTGAHLDAWRALLAAMTETPYPYPGGPPSQPAMKGLLRVPMEKLPNYSCGDAVGDLALIETLLVSNGFGPIYVDLTRRDVGIPVVRAIVPGMELLGDFDRFSRVNPRLYANYDRMFRPSG